MGIEPYGGFAILFVSMKMERLVGEKFVVFPQIRPFFCESTIAISNRICYNNNVIIVYSNQRSGFLENRLVRPWF